MKTVVGVFSDAREARRTFDELVSAGFGQGDISVLTSLATQSMMNLDLRPIDASDAGRLVGRGPLATTMTGKGSDTLAGSLRNVGLSNQLSDHYARAVKFGETLESIVVEDGDVDRAVSIMSQRAAPYREGVPMREESTAPSALAGGVTGAAAIGKAKATMEATTEKEEIARHAERQLDVQEQDRRIPVLKEEMKVGKREVERGHVHVSVRVTEHPVSENINLREEHVYVERRAANRAPSTAESRFESTELDIVEHGEDPVVSKEVKVVEEVVISKRLQAHDEQIRDTLRDTEVEVTEDRFDPSFFRKHFEAGGARGKFEDHLPGYELGHTLRGSRAKRWEDVEPKAKATWESKRPGTWDKIKDTVRYGWSRGKEG